MPMPENTMSVFIVLPTNSRHGNIAGAFGTLDVAVEYASNVADHENATGGNAHLLIQEWSGNSLFRTWHIYGTDAPMNGPF